MPPVTPPRMGGFAPAPRHGKGFALALLPAGGAPCTPAQWRTSPPCPNAVGLVVRGAREDHARAGTRCRERAAAWSTGISLFMGRTAVPRGQSGRNGHAKARREGGQRLTRRLCPISPTGGRRQNQAPLRPPVLRLELEPRGRAGRRLPWRRFAAMTHDHGRLSELSSLFRKFRCGPVCTCLRYIGGHIISWVTRLKRIRRKLPIDRGLRNL
jgi:hypothetical protein